MTWPEVFAELESLSMLERDWDGFDADPVPSQVLQCAIDRFKVMESNREIPPDYLYALADGSIIAEWFMSDPYGRNFISFSKNNKVIHVNYQEV